MCMLRSLQMSSMPYCSMHMPIGWNGLTMPTEGCFVACPLSLLTLRSGVLNRTLSYMMKVILNHVPIDCGVADPNVY